MFAWFTPRSKLLALLTLALGLMAVAAACGSSDPTATPTPPPTPTPSPTPTPVPDPIIDLSGDSTFADLVALLPEEAVRCISGELGVAAYNALLEQQVFTDGLQFGDDFPLQCLTTDVFVSVLIAALSETAGGLSDATTVCIRQTFAGLDVENFAGLTGGDVDTSSLTSAMGATIGLLLCLNEDEAEKITAGGLFGDVGGASALSMADLRCVLEVVDVSSLLGLFETIDSGGVPDLNVLFSLLPAINECGVDLSALADGGDGNDETDGPATTVPDLSDFDLTQIDQLPPEAQEIVNCLVGVLGEDTVNAIFDGTYIPSFEDFAALGQCNIDLSQLGDIGALLGG